MRSEQAEKKLLQPAREAALQMIYARAMAAQPPEEIGRWFLDAHPMPAAAGARARHLLQLAATHQARIEELVGRHAHDWRWERLAMIDRSLMTLATAELLETSSKAEASSIIRDSLVLAKRFSQPKVLSLLRALIEAVALEVRHAEAGAPAPAPPV